MVVVSGSDSLPVQPSATGPAPLIGGYEHIRAHLRLAAAKFPPITMCERKPIARDAAAVARAAEADRAQQIVYAMVASPPDPLATLPSSHVRNLLAAASHQEWTGRAASDWWSRDNSISLAPDGA